MAQNSICFETVFMHHIWSVSRKKNLKLKLLKLKKRKKFEGSDIVFVIRFSLTYIIQHAHTPCNANLTVLVPSTKTIIEHVFSHLMEQTSKMEIFGNNIVVFMILTLAARRIANDDRSVNIARNNYSQRK